MPVKNFIDENYIEVTGKSEMELIPNEIYLQIYLQEKDLKRHQSLEQLEQLMINALNALGIDSETALRMHDASNRLQHHLFKKSEKHSQKQYQLLLNRAEQVSEVFEALEPLNIQQIRVDKLNHSEIEQYRRAVKIAAIEAAKAKATALAEAIGQSIGKAIYIKETDFGSNNMLSNMVVNMPAGPSMSGKSKGSTTIEFAPLLLESSILVFFQLC